MEKPNKTKYFREFGKKMFVAAILSIVTIASTGLASFVICVILLLAVEDLKKINRVLKNEKLEKFNQKIKVSSIIILLAGIAIIVMIVLLVGNIVRLLIGHPSSITLIRIFLIIISILYILHIFANILQFLAWRSINEFFIDNYELFPNRIPLEVREGSEKLKKAAGILIASHFFQIITVIIAIYVLPQISSLFSGLPTINPLITIFNWLFLPLVLSAIFNLIGYIFMIQGYFNLASLKKL